MTRFKDPIIGLTMQKRVDYTRKDTILRLAIVGKNDAIKSLLQKGQASPNDRDANDGTTALHYATSNGQIETCRLLLQEGADPFVENDFGLSPFQEAWSNIYGSIHKSQSLLDLAHLFQSTDYDDLWEFSDIHKIVLGILPLDLHIQLQKPEIKAKIGLPDSGGRTPLHWAAQRGAADVVELLLLAGANPNRQEAGGDTALHAAAKSQNPQCFQLLILAGGNVHIANSWGDQVLHCACNNRDVPACIKPLLIAGADINCRTRGGCTPLSQAAARNSIKVGSLLLHLNADLHLGDKRGETPLHRAIFASSHDFIRLLLRHGGDCANVTIHGSTILHYTAQHADIETVEILTSTGLTGVDADARDTHGCTASQVLQQRVAVPEALAEAFVKLVKSVRTTAYGNLGSLEDSGQFFDAWE